MRSVHHVFHHPGRYLLEHSGNISQPVKFGKSQPWMTGGNRRKQRETSAQKDVLWDDKSERARNTPPEVSLISF